MLRQLHRWVSCVPLLLCLGGCGVPSALPTAPAAEPARVQAGVLVTVTRAATAGAATATRRSTPGTPTSIPATATAARPASPTTVARVATASTATPPKPAASRTATPSRPTSAPLRTPTRPAGTTPPARQGQVTLAQPFVDDFTDPRSGWYIGGFRGASADNTSLYRPDGYHLTVGIVDTYNSSDNIRIGDVRDVAIEVEVTKLSGDDNRRAGFGVHCRYYNPRNFYVFRLFGYGGYGVYRMEDGVEYRIAGSAGVPHPAIRPGDGTNQLRAECNGDTLTLTVNGEQLFQGVDPTPFLDPGRVALFACGCGGSTIDVLFQNFRAEAPQAHAPAAP